MSTHDELKSFVDRIERLNEEHKVLSDDVSDIYKEAKSRGYDSKALKIVVQRRAKDSNELCELDSIVATYEAALGTDNAIARAPARGGNESGSGVTTIGRAASVVKDQARQALAAKDNLDIPDFLDRRPKRDVEQPHAA